jgi:hypothetical protein
MKKFVTNIIGAKYVTSQPYDLERSFVDASPGTPIFVFLSPGVDVVSDSALSSQCLAEFHTLCLFEGQVSSTIETAPLL